MRARTILAVASVAVGVPLGSLTNMTETPAAAADAPPPANVPEGQYVTVYEARIHYVERGDGPVVILVHGLGDDIRTWQVCLNSLSRTNRVIALDMIGHGQSAKPFLNYRPATFADFLIGFLDELKIERATLVGNSLGGWASALVALRQPERVERLVLVDSAGFADQQVPSVLYPGSLEDCRELFKAANEPKAFLRVPAGDHNDPPSELFLKAIESLLATSR